MLAMPYSVATGHIPSLSAAYTVKAANFDHIQVLFI